MATLEFGRSAGALLLGGLFASLLSGFVMVQTYMYYKTYRKDHFYLKALVFAIVLLDSCHTAFIWSALWSYLIDSYGQPGRINVIHWNVKLTIITTAILILLVQLFFAHRIFKLSKRNFFVTTPIIILAMLRFATSCASFGEMFRYGTYTRFSEEVKWVFTCVLALSTAVDMLSTGSLFALLHTSRTGAPSVNALIDTLIMFAFETASLTSAGTVVTMICWLAMPNNIVFLGVHFVIGKLYALSLLVTLNMREDIRRGRSGIPKDLSAPVFLDARGRRQTLSPEKLMLSEAGVKKDAKRGSSDLTQNGAVLEVKVERTVHYDV